MQDGSVGREKQEREKRDTRALGERNKSVKRGIQERKKRDTRALGERNKAIRHAFIFYFPTI